MKIYTIIAGVNGSGLDLPVDFVERRKQYRPYSLASLSVR